ncbi:sphingomyelinase [Leptospira noguchii]|uniref:sphingomyelinase n=1 Tax=Leptospira noguchii TaxID=28182 RepID=UPI00034DBBD7|nr:hypothetical protein [Leptospira noguchii]
MISIFQKKKIKRLKNSKIFTRCYCVCLFLFLNCLPEQQSHENNLLLSLLSNDHIFGLVKDKSAKQTKPNQKYFSVTLISQSNGKKVQADLNQPNGWLKVSAESDTKFTKFNLYQYGGDPNCIRSGHIRIEPTAYPNYYWNWWFGGGGGNYAYYPKYNDGSNNLEIISPSRTCLESGDTVMFIDWDTSAGGYYFLTNWNGGGSWNEYIFLWDELRSQRSTFIVELQTDNNEQIENKK